MEADADARQAMAAAAAVAEQQLLQDMGGQPQQPGRVAPGPVAPGPVAAGLQAESPAASETNGYGKAPMSAGPVAAGPYTPATPAPAAQMSEQQEKRMLQNKLWEVQKVGIEGKAKWWSFCKNHANGDTKPESHDVAFFLTFFEALESGDLEVEDGCPFVPAQAGQSKGKGKDKGGWDKGGWDKGGDKGWGKDKGFGKDKGKGFGKDSGKGSDKGGKGKGGGGAPENKIFAGGLPKTATEEALTAHFSKYGAVQECSLKYDDWGGFRGFAFVTFRDAGSANAAMADAANQVFEGKWIDCKPPGGDGGGKGGKDKGGKDKGFGKDKGGKDKGGFGKDKGWGKDKGFGKDKGKGFGKDKGKKGW